MSSFWVVFWLIFWAEMGDKTQFVALTYATRYALHHVILGIIWPIALVFLLSVGAGTLIGSHVHVAYVQAASALCFLGFALWTLRENGEEDEGSPKKTSTRHPILAIGTAFFFAEFGDKTMFVAATLAASRPWLPVWSGSVLAMIAADGLGVVLGRALQQRIPEVYLKWITAAAFLGFALWSASEAYRSWGHKL